MDIFLLLIVILTLTVSVVILRRARLVHTQDLALLKTTNQKLAREQGKVYAVLQSISEGAFVIDTDYKVTMFNETAAHISGFDVTDVLGQPYQKVLEFVFERDGKPNRVFIEKAIKTGEISELANHSILIHKSGRIVPITCGASPIKDRDNQVTGAMILFRDISKEREVDRMKTEFISLASHQLRTPLTAIKLFVEMLVDEQVGKLNDQQQDYMYNVQRSTTRMIHLVNELLNVSRIETGRLKITPQKLQLEEFIQDTINEVQPISHAKGGKISFQSPETKTNPLWVDPTLLRQVVANLISNALAYSKPGECTITVKLTVTETDYIIEVHDTGLGIPRPAHDKIFTKFFRASNAVQIDPEGSGLGLYVSRLIVGEVGGKIWFESKLNHGSSFYISLPLTGMKIKEGDRSLEK